MSGFVSRTELKYVMSHLGVNLTDQELTEMIIEVSNSSSNKELVLDKVMINNRFHEWSIKRRRRGGVIEAST